MKNPLVSIIIPTRNSEKTLEKCLQSIREQTYKNIEIIVVDNNSTDGTSGIAKKYADAVFNKGPERSAQRNYGAEKSYGVYFLFIDSDMELTPKVIEECVDKATGDSKIKGIIIPEESFGEGFWAQCKALERSFYIGVDWIEAARFYDKYSFKAVEGYDENLVSGEDFDISQRVRDKFQYKTIARVNSFIRHNEGHPTLLNLLKKKFYYGKHISLFANKKIVKDSFAKQSNILTRYKLYLSQPKKLFARITVGFGMLFLKTAEFIAGALGILLIKLQ